MLHSFLLDILLFSVLVIIRITHCRFINPVNQETRIHKEYHFFAVNGMSSASSLLTANTSNMAAFLFSLLKGQCHEMYFFLQGPTNQNSFFEWAPRWSSQFLAVFLWRKSKMKFLYASMKSLTNCENPSSNLLQRACSGFPEAACDSKNCSESRLWF